MQWAAESTADDGRCFLLAHSNLNRDITVTMLWVLLQRCGRHSRVPACTQGCYGRVLSLKFL